MDIHRKRVFKESFFGTISYLEGGLLYCFFLAVLLSIIVLVSIFHEKLILVLRHKCLVFTLSLSGSICLFFSSLHLEYLGHTLAIILGMTFLFIFSIGFIAVFFAWIVEIRELMFSQRLNLVVVLMLAAMALSYIISPSNLNNSEYRAILPIVSLTLSGACYFAYVKTRQKIKNYVPSKKHFDQKAGKFPHKAWLIPLFLLALTINLISYVEVFVPDYHVITNESLLSYTLPFILSLILALIAVQSGRTPFFHNKLFWHVCLGFLALIFLSFFVTVFVLAIQTSFCFEVMYLIRRMTKIMFFTIFMVVIYQEDLNPIRIFGIYYLFPLFAPCLAVNAFQLFLAYYSPNTLTAIGELAVGYALFLGFCLILCLVFICVMFINGSIAKIAFSPQQDDTTLKTSRNDLCNQIGDRFELTQREKEILYCISLGYSMKKTSEVLYISTSTVHTHTATVYRKLGVHSRQEVIDLIDTSET